VGPDSGCWPLSWRAGTPLAGFVLELGYHQYDVGREAVVAPTKDSGKPRQTDLCFAGPACQMGCCCCKGSCFVASL